MNKTPIAENPTSRIMIIIGSIVLLVTMFLPFAYPTEQQSFIDLYTLLPIWIGNRLLYESATALTVLGALLTAILFPVAIALSFTSLLKPKLSRVAGLVGIVGCVWIIISVANLVINNPGLGFGYGIVVGLVGSIIVFLSKYMGKMSVRAASNVSNLYPPPPAPSYVCPSCGRPLTFIQQYNRWYCQNEQKYV